MADLKGAYFSIEDKWYALVDKVSDKLPFVGGIVDGFEERGIPSFPLAIAIIIIIILLLAFFVFGQGAPLTINVLDESGNPLAGAQVSVFLNGTLVELRDTGINGKVVFYLTDGTYSVKVDKDGYASETKNDVSLGEQSFTLNANDTTLKRAVTLKTATGLLINGSGVVRYSCVSTGDQYIATYNNGVFTADFTNCDEITIDSIEGYTVVEGRISFSGNKDALVEELSTDTGTITVSLTTTGDIPAGIRVTITGEDGTPVQTKYTSAGSGIIIFQDAPTKKYYVAIHDPNGNYADYDGSTLGDLKELAKDQTISFNVTLQQATSSTISVTVKSAETGLPVSGAEVKLQSTINQSSVDIQTTPASGQVTFNVPQGTSYLLSVEHPSYMIMSPTNISSGETRIVELVKATETNSQSLLVKVVDAQGEIIDNVKVILKKLDDTKIDEKTTGANGEVEFFNLEIGSYYAYVVKDGFEGATSTSIQVLPRRQNILEVKLDIDEGTFRLKVYDEVMDEMPGTVIKAINYFTGKIEEEKTTDISGETIFNIREDKKIYFLIEGSGYLDYYTSAMYPDASSTITKEIIMRKSSGTLKANITGIFLGDAEIGSERVVGAGVYTVRGILEVPQGNYTEAGFHLRTGKATEGTINLMEEDFAKIGDVESSADRTEKGTTYSPPNNYNVDMQNLTNGTAKWANSIWKNPNEGVYEVEAELIIENVQLNSGINLWYRGWAKGSSLLRDPPSTGTQELYAGAKNYLLTSGATNLCKDGFCRDYAIKTLTGSNAGKIQYISNKFNANKGNTYMLIANLVNRKAMSNAVLEIEGKGLDVQEIKVNGVVREDPINLGNLASDMHNLIEVTFVATASGDTSLKLMINSATQTEFEEEILVNVKANKKITFDMVPKQIIPYITNTLFFEVKDTNSPIGNALIEIKNNGEVLDTVETDAEGRASYELSAPSAGDTITITIRKEGFDELVYEKTVDEEILLLIPPEISETIKIGEVASIEQTIIIENATVEKLKIKSISFGGELSSYLDMSFAEGIIGDTINPEEDANYSLKIKPNSTAGKLREPRTVEGDITINVQVEDAQQTYTNKLPVRIRLSMPGYLDSDKCLKVSPGNIEFTTSTSEVSQSIEIENTCTAEGIKVNLHDLEVKVNEASKYGSVSVSGAGMGATLGTSYVELANLFEKDAKETLTVRFIPSGSVSSGEQKLDIMFRAKNLVDDGEETIDTKMNVDLSMSNLSQCLEIEEPTGGITLNVAGWNLGYNGILNSNIGSQVSAYQGFSSTYGRNSMPYGMQQTLPFMSQGNQQYQEDSFIITNNCAVDVEVDLNPDSRINVSEEELTLAKDSDTTITVSPGYTLGRYRISVSAKVANSEETKKSVDSVDVTVRRLGDIDRDCIKTNVTKLNFNSFIYQAQRYKVYNYCYDTGTYLSRGNTAVTVSCTPLNSTTTGVPLLQVGQEQIYGQPYPLTNTYNSYYDYIQPKGCTANACAMVAGTRVYSQNLIQEGTKTVEEITFEVMPSSQYMPQRRLFDSQTGSYGLFSNLADIRQWATETDARTNIYGNLNVQYTNQYGSTQCMEFPVQIEDNWRLLESVDSAINWGDPNASPSECVKGEHLEALNIKKYWSEKGNNKGAVPDSEFNKKGNYLYIAEPPAVNIGPMPTASAISNYPYQGWDKKNVSTGVKNCGLMDSLSDITYESNFAGIKIKVEAMNKGSLIGNTRGPNLGVEIDRSGMDQSYGCVYINTPVTAKLKRAINWKTEEITWKLTAVVTRPGYKLQTDNPETECYTVGTAEVDCEDLARKYVGFGDANKIYTKVVTENPKCAQSLTRDRVQEIIDGVEQKGKCSTDSKEYGFDLIDKVSVEEMTIADLEKYCENKFCNNEMLTVFLQDKYKKIKEATASLSGIRSKGRLSELYKDADSKAMFNYDTSHAKFTTDGYNFYIGSNGALIKQPGISLKEGVSTGNENAIMVDPKTSDVGSIIAMKTVLTAIPKEVKDELLLKMPYSKPIEENLTIIEGASEIKLLRADNGGNMYLSLNIYLNILEKITTGENYTKCDNDNCNLVINATQNIRLEASTIEYLVENAVLVRGIIADGKETAEEQEAIYTANPTLNEVHNKALFGQGDSENYLYLTELDDKPVTATIFEGLGLDTVKDITTTFSGKDGVGKYKVELDANFLELRKANAKVTIKLTRVDALGKAEKNEILQSGFNLYEENSLNKSTEGIIIEDDISQEIFYTRAPVLLSATINAQESTLEYKLDSGTITKGNNLINWYLNGAKTTDTKSGSKFGINVGNSATARTYKGVYYYPTSGTLIFNTSSTNKTASITGKGIVLSKNTGISASVSVDNKGDDLQLTGLTNPTLKEIIALVRENDLACISEDGQKIYWNELELLNE